MVRINKFLAQCNLGSRRKVEELILTGKVKLNGKTITSLSTEIDPAKDIVEFDDQKIQSSRKKIYIMLNKPKQYLVTASDDFARKTVFELLPDFKEHIFPVGRLDYLSEGLLVLTNDGEFSEKIIHPKNKLPKLYKVACKGFISNESIKKLRTGIEINKYRTKPAKVFIKNRNQNTTTLKITISEGKKRQIRYMIKAIGSEVLELKRLQIGDVLLGKLPKGEWRFLKAKEVSSLLTYNETRKEK
ncbi:MAG: pseudouridine synthase [Candidatus Cloacimonadales bacterium]|nr:pseudouridine synthase [Candidatus Cloacimonadales bacterium]